MFIPIRTIGILNAIQLSIFICFFILRLNMVKSMILRPIRKKEIRYPKEPVNQRPKIRSHLNLAIASAITRRITELKFILLNH